MGNLNWARPISQMQKVFYPFIAIVFHIAKSTYLMKSFSGQSCSQLGIVMGISSAEVLLKSKPSTVLSLRYHTLTK